jgi:hypothetical protein
MHSHPSKSIGHVDGYSAHSLEDYLIFQYHVNRPVFVRMVVSGHWFYAAVYRKGLTRFDPTEIKNLLGAHVDAMQEYFIRVNKLKSWQDVRDKQNDVAIEGGDHEKYMLEWKRKTPGLGKWLMEASIQYNMDLANRFQYGFYSAKNSRTLRLQAGPHVVNSDGGHGR